ncbi:MAG: hypothetical protein IKJ45_08370, partial [Kiritimatiellae bacterium]|nr:hypothetical protein [Kiritimatiellia bacterium]
MISGKCVGGKVCLAILSVLSPAQLSQAVSAQDKTSFLKAPGVGPKLAARLVTELKDKIVTIPIEYITEQNTTPQNETQTTQSPSQTPTKKITEDTDKTYQNTEDVTSALTNLGYQKIDAYKEQRGFQEYLLTLIKEGYDRNAIMMAYRLVEQPFLT